MPSPVLCVCVVSYSCSAVAPTTDGAANPPNMASMLASMSERKRGQDLTRIGTALALAFLVAGLSLPFVSRLGGLLLPQSTRAQIGDALVESVPQDQFCRSKAGLAALHSVVQKLSEASGSDQEFRVYVAHSKQLNAFAAPGGRLVILSPIIEQARNPEEMAGTLAHEMAHVLERHPSTGIVKSLGLGVLSLLNPGAERLGAGVAETLRERKNSRNDELDADRVGVELLNTAGFDSRGSIGFFERIMDKGSDTPLELLSTHPSDAARIEALKKMAKAGETVLDDAGWRAVRDVCSEIGAPLATVDAL